MRKLFVAHFFARCTSPCTLHESWVRVGNPASFSLSYLSASGGKGGKRQAKQDRLAAALQRNNLILAPSPAPTETFLLCHARRGGGRERARRRSRNGSSCPSCSFFFVFFFGFVVPVLHLIASMEISTD